MKATVRLEHELLAVQSEAHVHALLELAAPPNRDAARRPPLNLALVLDRSGSMAGAKLENTKHAAAQLVRRLAPTDRVALIAYDDVVDLVHPLAAPDDSLIHAIRAMGPRGSTNLSGGWLKGIEELGRAPAEEFRKVLLLTDGLANVGIVDPTTLVAMASESAAGGIGTTTIGFGSDFDESLLTTMADGGNGNSYYVDSPDEAPGVFAREFDNLMAIVAQNVSVEIRPTPEVQVVGVLNEYPAVAVPGGVQIQLGDAYSDERRRVVFELYIPRLETLGVATVAEIVVRYVSVAHEVAAHEVTIPLPVNIVSADEAAGHGPDAGVRDEVMILKAAKARDEARRRADHGDFAGAQKVLTDAAEDLGNWAPHSAKHDQIAAEASVLDELQAQHSAHMWTPQASKDAHFQVQSMRRQRPTRSNPNGGPDDR